MGVRGEEVGEAMTEAGEGVRVPVAPVPVSGVAVPVALVSVLVRVVVTHVGPLPCASGRAHAHGAIMCV